MTKDQLLTRLEKAWTEFRASYAGLSEAQMTRPGVTEDWSVKDILTHVTTWEQEALKALPIILAGRPEERYSVKYGGIDAFNALMTKQKRGLSLAAVLKELDETHGRLVAYVQAAPDEQIKTDTRFRRRLRLDSYSHYPIHTRGIRAWREGGAG
ncbi:MAG: maleylpyruvate isomerase N-terminal domain-containing protein [Candidatus Promineifilaceae bacterium]